MVSVKSFLVVAALASITSYSYADDATVPPSADNSNATLANASAGGSYNLADHLSGTADIVSNYVWRGVSQTDNAPAVQTGATYSFDSGFYAGLWGSSVNFKNDSGATTELDYVVGFKHKLTEDFNVSVFGTHYNYPRTSGLDYNEYTLQGSYKILTATFAYSHDEFSSGHSGEYYNLAADYPVPGQCIFNVPGVAVGASVGRFELPTEAGFSYNDYKLYVSKELTKNFKLIVNFTDTNGENRTYPADKAHLFADLSASF